MRYQVEGNHIEIYFDSIPDENMRECLKTCGWRWFGKKKCWSNFYTKDNMDWAKNLCEGMAPKKKSRLLSLERRVITMNDLVIRSNSFYCNKHHDITDLAGEFELLDRKGSISHYLVPIAYCKSCDKIYLLEETYKALKTYNSVIAAQIMTYKEYESSKGMPENLYEWKDISPLRKWGYTVSQVEGYSSRQRQAILEDIVDYGGMPKNKVLSYLDFFIKLNEQKGNLALEKWKADREHIANYKLGSAERVRIGTIIILD